MLFDQCKQVKAFVFAIDGVCTDGKVWLSERGDRWMGFHSRDRYALRLAAQYYPIALVGNDPLVMGWVNDLGITDLFHYGGSGISLFRDWIAANGLATSHVLYMGGDVGDLDFMASGGFSTCPADATDDVKAAAAYISHCNGGAGAVRDIIEKVMKLQGTWNGANVKTSPI